MSAQEHPVESVQRQLAAIAEEKPGLEPLLRAFGGYQAAVAACRVLLPLPDVASLAPDNTLLQQGVPLLEQSVSPNIDFQLGKVAPVLLPALTEAFPALEESCDVLGAALEKISVRNACTACLEMTTPGRLGALAQELGLHADILGFMLHCLSKPGIEMLAAALEPVMREIPWTFWLKGQCPICGGAPSMSLLRQGVQEPTEYLKNISAQRWLCCSHCAHTWRIGRTMCPTCGHDEKENRAYFYVEGKNLERVEVCNKCNHYLLTMDIRDRLSPLDHRLAPLGLIHLDILASKKGYAPQTEMPWTILAAEHL